ncbi:hypothetical protein [Collimonas fungivorans]|uniref:hypothetical protein n=1 Tax=Collimonas fungivorans TaxID=158899 RepID=UPI0007788A00|nr:hypothetical protein [Collimonas fungivorans]
MTASRAHLLSAVFTKTAKGREEIAQRTFGLSARQRSILIVMDGTKNLDALKGVMPQNELDDIVSVLSTHLFITLSGAELKEVQEISVGKSFGYAPFSAQESIGVTPRRAENTLTQDDAKIREIKDFMTTTAHTYLGLLAADLIQQIERAKTSTSLRTVVGQWHMALRGSKHGNRFAGPYLDQVSAALAANEE